MSEQRDELAELIANTECPRLVPPWPERDDRSPVKWYSRKTADAILAAGWTKPRTITTVEELDTLPIGSKVVSAGYEWTKNYQTNHTPGYEAEREVWFNVYDDFETSEELSLPAAVLYEPTA